MKKEHTPYCLSTAVRAALENARDSTDPTYSYAESTKVAMEWALMYLDEEMMDCRCDQNEPWPWKNGNGNA